MHENLCVEGAESQRIYSLRGPPIGNMLKCKKSYDEMQDALKLANTIAETGKNRLVNILTGQTPPTFHAELVTPTIPPLNASQNRAVHKILPANELARKAASAAKRASGTRRT